MSSISLDPDDYSLEDTFHLFGLGDSATSLQISSAADAIIKQATSDNNEKLASFITKLKKRAIQENAAASEKSAYPSQHGDDPSVQNLWLHENRSQNNQNQREKITDRQQQVQIFESNDSHSVLGRNHLGVSNTHDIPVVQGTINPNLKNVISRMVCIDSQFRQNILPFAKNSITTPTINTDYTLDLSDPLKNVLSIRLNSVHIPTTWYTFSKSLGNTCFLLNDKQVELPEGNYTHDKLVAALTTLLTNVGATVTIDAATNKLKITVTTQFKLTFYRPDGLGCGGCGSSTFINNHIGWHLGFRIEPNETGTISKTFIPTEPPAIGVMSDVPVNIYGPRYFILAVDDFNQNHLNKGLVNIIDGTTKLSLPEYYTPDISCSNTAPQPFPYNNTKSQVTPQNPRKLTQAQLYSINEILLNQKTPNLRAPGPTTTNTLGIIPLKNISSLRTSTPPSPLIDTGSSLQTNKREYFGPVNIERMRVRLFDDKGHLVNLNDNDWSFTLTVEQLYQY